MPDSYAARIEAAEVALAGARDARDRCYPGSPDWENENAKVREWERALEDLQRAEAS